MTIYEDTQRSEPEPRIHPWTFGGENKEFQYTDFKKFPERIRTDLEDFFAYSAEPAIQLFYEFLEWANGSDSEVETNDCAFRPPAPHRDRHTRKQLSCHGRVVLFFRRLEYNVKSDACEWLKLALVRCLSKVDDEFLDAEGVIGYTEQPAYFRDLHPTFYPTAIRGTQLMLSSWAYGDSREECFRNLHRLFKNLFAATQLVSNEIRHGLTN